MKKFRVWAMHQVWLFVDKRAELIDKLPPLEWILDVPIPRTLCLLAGHEATSDCTIPEHDYCLYCNKGMPFQYKRK